MALRVVRLGSPRAPGEGLRIGTVRRPPRGVPKEQYAALDYYDEWLPELAPSAELMGWIHAEQKANGEADAKAWQSFSKRYRSEMARPEALRLLKLLAGLSRQTELSVGCYCENEARCHRSLLRDLLRDNGAAMAP